jgi:hypothetical protein
VGVDEWLKGDNEPRTNVEVREGHAAVLELIVEEGVCGEVLLVVVGNIFQPVHY